MDQQLTTFVTVFIVLAAIWEVLAGRTRDGKKTRQDWKVAFLATHWGACLVSVRTRVRFRGRVSVG